MKNRNWADNAFWVDSETKDKIRAILFFEDEGGRRVKQEMTVHRNLIGTEEENPEFKEILSELGEEKIDENTNNRKEQKRKLHERKKEAEKAEKQRKMLAKLFEEKIEVLEIDEIKNSKNRELKSKVRRAKSSIELQMYAIMLMMEETRNNEESP